MNSIKQSYKEDIDYYSRLIFETIHVPVFYVTKDLEILSNFPAFPKYNPVYPSYTAFIKQLNTFDDPIGVPVLRTTRFLENFISITVGSDIGIEGTFILGPSLYTPVTEEILNGLLNDFQVRTSAESLQAYYESLVVINKRTLINAGLLATYLLYSKRLFSTDIIQKDLLPATDLHIEANPDLEVSKSRQEISFHTSYEWEKILMECIKDGRKDDLLKKFILPDIEGRLGVLSKKSHLRSQKNLVITIITVATRYAIDGGLHPELAFTMSDLYIQGLEDIKDEMELQTYSREALCDFTDRVNEAKQQKYTLPVIECQSFIFKHLYEDISLGRLAKVANMNQNYLSTLFKKEVGLSISEYILLQKVEEAKRLLLHSDYPLSEIYTWLNFHDQSHFTKVFKKYTGTTPKKFKTKKRFFVNDVGEEYR